MSPSAAHAGTPGVSPAHGKSVAQVLAEREQKAKPTGKEKPPPMNLAPEVQQALNKKSGNADDLKNLLKQLNSLKAADEPKPVGGPSTEGGSDEVPMSAMNDLTDITSKLVKVSEMPERGSPNGAKTIDMSRVQEATDEDLEQVHEDMVRSQMRHIVSEQKRTSERAES